MDPFVSVVTGTYNRLPYLKEMVESVRHSIYYTIPYEIILVDGGSIDGTIEWCKKQKDVVLIEQGELLGAVKAFNAGFAVAKGRYVVIANDDITFMDESITNAILFMEGETETGIGCFWQDRDDKKWHVEAMHVYINGTGRPGYYGQVCIIPKWLGDEVGWWGDYLHTYGGDNELSANVYRLGYLIKPIPCGCVHDLKVYDQLREINKGDPKEFGGGHHPDTVKFHDKWKNGINVGKLAPGFRYERRKFKIFYLPIYEPGHQIQKETKVGLLKSLQKVSLVFEYDYANGNLNDMLERAYDLEPDLFVMQIQDANGMFNKHVISNMKAEHPNARFFLWNGDYHPNNLYAQEYIEMLKLFHLTAFATEECINRYPDDVKKMYLQIGFEEHETPPPDDLYDIVFLANGYSDKRKNLARFLKEFPYRVGLFGSWPREFGAIADTTYDFYKGAEIMRASKFVISDQQWPHARGYVSNRLFQALYAGGGVVLQQWFDGIDEVLGFEHNKHLLVWKDMEEIADLVGQFIDKDKTRAKIAEEGREFVLKNYSFDVFVKKMLEALYDL